MKIKKSNLEWYALMWDPNKNQVRSVNVLSGIAEIIAKKVKSGIIHDKESLRVFLKKKFMYEYWSKYEYEMLVGDLNTVVFTNTEKIDVWKQLEMNLDPMVEYINLKCDLKF